jgi:hypothetical protein
MFATSNTLNIKSLARRAFALGAVLMGLTALNSVAQAQTKKGTAEQPELKQVLVFQPDTKGGNSDAIADDILQVMKDKLTATKKYEPIRFLSSLPTVRLAVVQGTLLSSDVRKPFDNDTKLKKLSGVTGLSYVIVASVDDYSYDSGKNQVDLVVSVRMIDYSGAKAVVRSAAQSASSPAGGNTPELKLASDLAKSLTDKLMTSVLTPKPPTPVKQ